MAGCLAHSSMLHHRLVEIIGREAQTNLRAGDAGFVRPNDVRGHEDDRFCLLLIMEGAGEQLAEPGNVAQERNFLFALGVLGFNEATEDDRVAVADADDGGSLLGVQVRRGGRRLKCSSRNSNRPCNWPTFSVTTPTPCAGRCGRPCSSICCCVSGPASANGDTASPGSLPWCVRPCGKNSTGAACSNAMGQPVAAAASSARHSRLICRVRDNPMGQPIRISSIKSPNP